MERFLYTEKYAGNEPCERAGRIEIILADITRIGTDAIVNAANEGLWAGEGVSGAIFDAAGRVELTRACGAIGYCNTGSAVITPGFMLSRYIIHAVGPRWVMDHDREQRQLYSAYQEALGLAEKYGCASVGFPLISAGVSGMPADIAWGVALQACLEFSGNIRIVFAVSDEDILRLGQEMLRKMMQRTVENVEPVQKVSPVQKDSMIVFCDPGDAFGFLSNGYLSEFYADGICYTSVEQYLAHQKAILFGKSETASRILRTNDPAAIRITDREELPRADAVWNGQCQIVLYTGLLCKFTQNVALRRALLKTGRAVLVLGTEGDLIFANGLSNADPHRFDMTRWRGQNLLGFALMAVRRELGRKTNTDGM